METRGREISKFYSRAVERITRLLASRIDAQQAYRYQHGGLAGTYYRTDKFIIRIYLQLNQ